MNISKVFVVFNQKKFIYVISGFFFTNFPATTTVIPMEMDEWKVAASFNCPNPLSLHPFQFQLN
jgi:hypothetical protein